jgi:hydrogenase expression/formation protein HypD
MKCVDEFRNRDVATTLTDRLKKTVRLPWTIMEACGRQTHAIIRFDLNGRLPKNLTLVHGSSVTISFNRSNAPFAREFAQDACWV